MTVTAETNGVLTTADVPQRVNIISRDEILAGEPGVDGPAMGGPAVRGLLKKNVAVYRDGVRYTTSAQRGGVSTFFNLQDAANLESLEVLRGANGAQYGSDSMGGSEFAVAEPGGWTGEIARGIGADGAGRERE